MTIPPFDETHEPAAATAAHADALPPDSEFESFYDNDSGVWTLRRISSTPPTCVSDDAS